ncbi:hypothetical protein NMG60_11028933 [Bertholletia excelsa]
MTGNQYILPLSEVKKHPDRYVNLIGVVVEFSIPRMSQGTDYCTILKVIDQSQHGPELCVNVFMDDIDQLPHIRSCRDIIFLCNVGIELHNEEFYAVFNKRYSSFALFDGNQYSNLMPYQSSLTFQLADSEKKSIARLRCWCLSWQFDTGSSEYLRSMKDLKEKEFVDLICLVIGICEVSNVWVLFLWDGTDAPSLSLSTKLEEHNSMQLQIESVPLRTDLLEKFPCVGTVLRVIVDKAYGEFGNHFHNIGYWMRLRNILCETDSGLWKGYLLPQSKVRLLAENDSSIVERKRKFTERLSLWGRVPMSSYHFSNYLTGILLIDFLLFVIFFMQLSMKYTLTGHETTKFVTLMDILTSKKDKVTFKTVVRVIEIYPPEVKDFLTPAGFYRMRITMEDPTARIHALLLAKDAEMFFGGFLPVEVLAAKINKLLGVPEDDHCPRNPPWIQCCIKLFSSLNEPGSSGGCRHYHIHQTKLVL